MKVDRYTKVVLTVIAVALAALAFKDIVAPQPTPTVPTAGRYQLVGYGANALVIDTRSGDLYSVAPTRGVVVLDTKTGYGQ